MNKEQIRFSISNRENMDKRVKWIDNAKGIAILLVIFGHVYGRLSFGSKFSFVYGIHLVTFFLISGFTFKIQPFTKEYVSSKFRRLMPPYFFTCAAVILFDVINSGLFGHDATIETITEIVCRDLTRSFFGSGSITVIGNIDIGCRIGAIWFLPALFFAIIYLQALYKICSNDYKVGIASAVTSVLCYITAQFIWLPYSILSGLFASSFIWIGYYLRKIDFQSKLNKFHYIGAIVVFAIGAKMGFSNVSFVRAAINDFVLSTVTALAGCLLIYAFSAKYSGKILALIGRNSMTIMCTHLFALETMGKYFDKIIGFTGLTGNKSAVLYISLNILFAVITALLIVWVKKIYNQSVKKNTKNDSNLCDCTIDTRDNSIDIVKAIFILLMIIGHFPINTGLRKIIYSNHMVSYVFFSGYFYRHNRSIRANLSSMLRSFILPYCVFVVCRILLDYNEWSYSYFLETAVRYVLGMSFGRRFFADVPSVGPVYFILMLFIVRILYMIIDKKCKNQIQNWCCVFIISVFGVCLGHFNIWLPWSFDVACYCVVFYKLGLACREYKVLSFLRDNPWMYFILAPIWTYMIYSGSMEIAVRNYGKFSIVIIGAIAGVMIVYMFSSYISKSWHFIANGFSSIGENTIILLIVHTLFNRPINRLVAGVLNSNSILYLICSVIIQIVVLFFVVYILAVMKNHRKLKNM